MIDDVFRRLFVQIDKSDFAALLVEMLDDAAADA